jgi:hypothetical protein
MLNIAFTLAFTLSLFFSPGGRVLSLFLDRAVVTSLPPYQAHLILALANYWIPTLLIYLLLRFLPVARRLRPNAGIHWLIGTGNFLLVLYVAVRIFASAIPGGGASFAVMSLARFVVLPAWTLQIIGFVWLVRRTVASGKNQTESSIRRFGRIEAVLVFIALSVPVVAAASTLYLGENAPLRLIGEAEILFKDLCQSAGENILTIPVNVESLYLDQDGGEYFDKVSDGFYSGHGGGVLAWPLVYGGWVSIVETQDYFQRRNNSATPYKRYTRDNRNGTPIKQLSSQYGVFSRSLVEDDVRKRLKVHGSEVTIKNLGTGEITATLTYFVSERHRTVCGQASDGNFAVSDFVKRALNLTKKDYDSTPEGHQGT